MPLETGKPAKRRIIAGVERADAWGRVGRPIGSGPASIRSGLALSGVAHASGGHAKLHPLRQGVGLAGGPGVLSSKYAPK